MSDDADILEKIKCKICFEPVDKRPVKYSGSKCYVCLHKKCLGIVTKVFVVDVKKWRCRSCCEDSKTKKCSRSLSTDDPVCDSGVVLKKEIDCLNREKELFEKNACGHEYTIDVQVKRIADLEAKCILNVSDKNLILPVEQKLGPVSHSQAIETNKLNDLPSFNNKIS
ncbi:unnamed protein product [Acanthoscelides obtectus]|uniref:Uncharacterized protein n=1 Tax=Acanthoscelides obtectus TaxID=200917 RepID=A0A9P0KAB5_ACAOB|nr:unnamed protein product [Acanthoscelides obtectus]CAK1633460.1 hypothetical protein AOBTE_LOCUS8153 [Acanthoscelides obtectus]